MLQISSIPFSFPVNSVLVAYTGCLINWKASERRRRRSANMKAAHLFWPPCQQKRRLDQFIIPRTYSAIGRIGISSNLPFGRNPISQWETILIFLFHFIRTLIAVTVQLSRYAALLHWNPLLAAQRARLPASPVLLMPTFYS